MLRRGLCALFLVGIIALLVLGPLGGRASVSEVDLTYAPFEPIKTFKVAAGDYEFTATSFTDTYATFTDDAYATDGDWSTAVYETTAVTTDYRPVAYWGGFDSGITGTGTITQVDVIIRISVSGTTNDEWGFILVNGGDTTLRAEATGDQALTNLTYIDVAEPSDASWSWTDVQSCQIDLDYDKVAAADNFDIYIYEVCLVITISSGTAYEKDMTEGVTAAETNENAASYDRTFTESVSAVDVRTTAADMARNLVESIGVVGVLTMLRGREKDLVETVSVADVRNFSTDYARGLVEAISVSDVWSKTFGLNRFESISAADTVDTSKFISKKMSESITVADVRMLSADFVRDLVEAITVVEIIDAQKLGGNDYEKDLTEWITVSIELDTEGGTSALAGSMFYQLFFSLDMWGYIGPLALVIIGYIVASKDKNLGVLWFVLESLVIANYLTLVAETPDYWWHIFILLIGCMSTLMYSIRDRW